MNVFIAAVPAVMQSVHSSQYSNAEFYYAGPGVVKCLAEDYANLIVDPNSVVRDRFVKDIVGDGAPNGLIWSLLVGTGIPLAYVNLDDVNAYAAMTETEKQSYACTNPEKALSLAVYSAFEDTIVRSAQDSNADLMVLLNGGELDDGSFAVVVEEEVVCLVGGVFFVTVGLGGLDVELALFGVDGSFAHGVVRAEVDGVLISDEGHGSRGALDGAHFLDLAVLVFRIDRGFGSLDLTVEGDGSVGDEESVLVFCHVSEGISAALVELADDVVVVIHRLFVRGDDSGFRRGADGIFVREFFVGSAAAHHEEGHGDGDDHYEGYDKGDPFVHVAYLQKNVNIQSSCSVFAVLSDLLHLDDITQFAQSQLLF